MTDSRLPSRWMTNPDMDALSDTAWRVFTLALMWCNENGTDGTVPRRAYRFLHPEGVDQAAIEELIGVALIVEAEDGFVMVNWSTDLGQSSAASVRQARENNRERQARWRDRHASESAPDDTPEPLHPPVTGDVTGYVTPDDPGIPDVTRYGTGYVVGKARTGKEVVNPTTYESEARMPATPNWKSKRIPNAECIVCNKPFESPDPGRFTVCPAQDEEHAIARGQA